MLPATAESLNDIDEDVPQPQGLQKRFSVGEKLPWKGICFTVAAVTADRLMLKPEGETWKHYKKRTGRE